MNVKEAIILFRYYQQSHHRKRTINSHSSPGKAGGLMKP